MRIAGLLVIAGCGATSPSAAPTLRAHPCDSAHWHDLAQTRLRVWPANATAPARVVEVAGAHIEVASATSSVIVTRWVPYDSLAPIAMSPTAVSPTRGAPGDPSMRILTGHRLDPPSFGWAAVHEPDGFVPASVAGVMWTEPDAADDDDTLLRYATGEVRSESNDGGAIRITMTTPTVIEVHTAASYGYRWVTVRLPFAELDGFWKPPPAKPRTVEDEARAEIEVEHPLVHSPIATGTCLRDAPNGRVVGMILDEDAFATPVPAKTTGWYVATLPTIWGPSTYYIDTPPIPMPPKPAPGEWPWPETQWNEW